MADKSGPIAMPTDGQQPAAAPEAGTVTETSPAHTETLGRLEYLIDWYEREARRKNLLHKALRVVSLSAAAAIPVLAAASAPAIAGATLGAAVVTLEGIQELFQFQANYVTFAATKEALKREQALYHASAGPYARTEQPHRLLAERVEALAAQETAGWAVRQRVDQQSS